MTEPEQQASKEFTPVVKMDHATPSMKDLREMEERINARFDGVDTRLDGVDARLDSIDDRLARIEAKLD